VANKVHDHFFALTVNNGIKGRTIIQEFVRVKRGEMATGRRMPTKAGPPRRFGK
jgi:hypothetical protein